LKTGEDKRHFLAKVQCEVTARKYALKQGNGIGVHFIKYDIQGCIFKMCRNLTYEVVGQCRRLKQLKKIVPQKLDAILFFDRIF
jgi:hypothetical protein